MALFQRIHLRARLLHLLCSKGGEAQYGHCVQYFEAVLYILLAITNIIAACCYFQGLPLEVETLGNVLYLITTGAAIALGLHDLHETLQAKSSGLSSEDRAELGESVSYLISSVLYELGIVFAMVFRETETFTWRSWFFVASNIGCIFAVYLNAIGLATEMRGEHMPTGLQQKVYYISCGSLFCTMMGAMLYIVASFLLLPEALNDYSWEMGVWCYVIGAVFFLVQAVSGLVAILISHWGVNRESWRRAHQNAAPQPSPEEPSPNAA